MPQPTRLVGLALLVFSAIPLHKLLDPARTGPAGAAVRASADAAWVSVSFGSLGVVVLATLLAFAVREGDPALLLDRIGHRLTSPRRLVFASGAGAVAGGLATLVALGVHGGMPTSVDEMVQLLHARALLSGSLTLPADAQAAAWAVQNGVFTEGGWASVYPPLHTLLLAGALALGVPWLVGPLAVGVGTAFSALAFEELMADLRVARASAVLLAVTPFWLLLGATHLSHASAAAALAAVVWTALRARDGSFGWSLALGAAIGAAVAARPWTGLLVSAALVVAVTGPGLRAGTRPRAVAVVLGGLPFAALLLGWNQALFGSPWTLGYTQAFGPAHGLGFHTDPWGNAYGPLQALAYTGADLVQLAAHLFESPLSPLLVIGVALVAGRSWVGLGPLLAWAGAGLAANALYWHHGVHMGPRMLFETVPAWVALTVAAAAALVGGAGRRDAPAVGGPSIPPRARRAIVWSLGLGIVGAGWLAPSVFAALRQPPAALELSTPPVPGDGPAIVFVHGSWASRIAARLAARGMRRDSIETALRRNDVCRADAYARALGTATAADPLDFEPRPGTPGHLSPTPLSPGNVVRVDPATAPTQTCLREARSDRFGTIELEPLLWQSPPLDGAPTVVARDMGPIDNAALIRETNRIPYVYVAGSAGPRLLAFSEGMELLWGGPGAGPER